MALGRAGEVVRVALSDAGVFVYPPVRVRLVVARVVRPVGLVQGLAVEPVHDVTRGMPRVYERLDPRVVAHGDREGGRGGGGDVLVLLARRVDGDVDQGREGS